MRTGYRILLAACIGFGLVVTLLQFVQAKDGDTSPLTPSDACIFEQKLTILVSHSFSGTAMPDTWEPVVAHCDAVAHKNPVYVDAAANLIERSVQSYCSRTDPHHRSSCLRNRREEDNEAWARAHRENEEIRQRIRGGHR